MKSINNKIDNAKETEILCYQIMNSILKNENALKFILFNNFNQ